MLWHRLLLKRRLWALPAALLLNGCIARAAVDVVTLPVKAGSQVVDWSTTSQEEADRNRSREARKQEERDRKEAKRAEKERREECRRAGYEDCG